MRVSVSFTPSERLAAPVAIAIDVLRATSTISQALASGYRRVLCCTEIDEAKEVAAANAPAILGGERACVRIPGFDVGNSPQEFTGGPTGETLVMTTTNGTRLLVSAAERCETVLLGSLLNLGAVTRAARESGSDRVVVLCAGVKGAFVFDDAYCAGRIAAALRGEPDDSAVAAIRLAESFDDHVSGLSLAQSARNLVNAGLESDIEWCARESVLDVVPRVAGRVGSAVEVVVAR